MKENLKIFNLLLGLSVVGGIVTGAFGLLAALDLGIQNEWAGAGPCLIAAALLFGLMMNALLRN